jgi:hypothetical protein
MSTPGENSTRLYRFPTNAVQKTAVIVEMNLEAGFGPP